MPDPRKYGTVYGPCLGCGIKSELKPKQVTGYKVYCGNCVERLNAIGDSQPATRLCVLCWEACYYDTKQRRWAHVPRKVYDHMAIPPLLGPIAKP